MEEKTYKPSEFLSEAEVSEAYRIPKSALRGWRKRGGGPPFLKFGRAVQYPKAELVEWLQSSLESSNLVGAQPSLPGVDGGPVYEDEGYKALDGHAKVKELHIMRLHCHSCGEDRLSVVVSYPNIHCNKCATRLGRLVQ